MSQLSDIRDYLATGASLTPLEALTEFGCMRLGARIYDLRREGVAIVTEMVEKAGKRYASYSDGAASGRSLAAPPGGHSPG